MTEGIEQQATPEDRFAALEERAQMKRDLKDQADFIERLKQALREKDYLMGKYLEIISDLAKRGKVR